MIYKLSKSIIEKLANNQINEANQEALILELFGSKEKSITNKMLHVISNASFDGKTIDQTIAGLGLDPKQKEYDGLKIATFLEKLKAKVDENEQIKKTPWIEERRRFNNRNFKKPSFNFFKGLIRSIFKVNWWEGEWNEYQLRLANYNQTRALAQQNNGYVPLRFPNPKKPLAEIEFEAPDISNVKIVVAKKPVKEPVFNKANPYAIDPQFSLPNLRTIKDGEDPQAYVDDIMKSRSNLDINEHNAELIVLSSFNMGELLAVQDLINNNQNLSYLQKAIEYKINQLSDNRIISVSINDKPVQIKSNTNFVRSIINKGFINDLKDMIGKGTSPYEALSSKPEIFKDDVNSNKSTKSRTKAKEKITDNTKPSTKALDINVVTGEGSVLLTNVPKTEVQNSQNGCWSCSQNVLLKCYGVKLTQEEIRAFRPEFTQNNIDENPLISLKNRLNFTNRVSGDVLFEINDYTDIFHKTIKDVAFKSKQIIGDVDFAYSEVKKILEEKKTPVSLLYSGHYRTVIGVDNGRFIFEDSNVRNKESIYHCISSEWFEDVEMKKKYPDNCTLSCSVFDLDHPIVISWIEKINEPDPQKYIDENLKGMEKKVHTFRSEGTTFTKQTFNETGTSLIVEDVVLPNDYMSLIKTTEKNIIPDEVLNNSSLEQHIQKEENIVIQDPNIVDINAFDNDVLETYNQNDKKQEVKKEETNLDNDLNIININEEFIVKK